MRYWLFNGEDIVGPFAPQELVVQEGFSAASMVCPEGASEDQNSWHTADSVTELQDALLKKTTGSQKKTDRISVPLSRSESKKLDKIKPLPLIQAKEDVIALPKPATVVPAATPKTLPEQPAAKQEKPAVVLTVLERFPSEAIPCSLPLIREETDLSFLPPLPEGDLPPAPEPAILPWKEPPAVSISETPEDLVLSKKSGPFFSPEEKALMSEEPPMSRPTAKRISVRVPTTPEVAHFLEKQKPPVKPSKAGLMLWVVAVLMVPGVVWCGLYAVRQYKPQRIDFVSDEINQELFVSQPDLQTPTAPHTQPAAVPVPKAETETDKALSAVKQYQLSGDRGTLAAYLDKVYQPKLNQGYLGSWSVEPLHKNTYIVKYRLTKTRTEPVVYVFQADGAAGKLTGALNNIALDLIGKI